MLALEMKIRNVSGSFPVDTEGESYIYFILFYCFILFACGNIHQDHEMFSDESRGRQDIYLCLAALLVLIFADSSMEVGRHHSALVR